MSNCAYAVLLIVAAAPLRAADVFPFRLAAAAEVVAEIDMRSPGADWARAGAEAALANLSLDGNLSQHVMLFAGAERYTYRVFLGELTGGDHRLAIERNEQFSAAAAGLEVAGVRFREMLSTDPQYQVLAYAPVLYARQNTIGKFTDIPLLTYCERLTENGQAVLQYTVIFSNEDGGTSTRALMARWGRTTDIEYVYRAYLDASGNVTKAIIQSRDHKDIEYAGPREGKHPLLMPVTDNNMVAPEGPSAIRYQPAPTVADLSQSSREQVMDGNPITWRVMAQELQREGKLRPYGSVEGQKISDPRNYLYLEARIQNTDSRTVAAVRLRDGRWRLADLGRIDYGIERAGWIRTAIELPPGTRREQIAEIGLACHVASNREVAGACRVDQVRRAFFLDQSYRPGASFWSLPSSHDFRTGEMVAWPVR
jgi:hypothetical protein